MKFRKLVIFSEVFLLLLFIFSFFDLFVIKASSIGLGEVSFTEKRTIYNGVSLEYAIGYNNNEEQKAYTVEIEKGALSPMSTFGEGVYGGEKLTSMVKNGESSTGKKVIVAINGDFYDTSNGIPLGAMISNGRVCTLGTTAGGETSVGFKKDGSLIFANQSFALSYNAGSGNKDIKYLNNERKYNTSDLFLYTSDFGTSTKSYSDGTEVVLDVVGETFVLDQEISATVVSRGVKDTSFSKTQIVIGSGVVNDPRLSELTSGKKITLVLKDNNPSTGWKDVVQSLGYPHLLAVDGKPTAAISDPAVHPRTALGVKADGTIVLFQVDGRQPGWSNGVTFKQMVEWLVDEKGCQTVINLDGGGSSTIIARRPGESDGVILNSPSDGVERSNANGILFFAEEGQDPAQELTHLHAYPKNLVIMEKASTNIVMKASDKDYFPLNAPNNLEYSVSEGLGTITSDGVFTASTGAKTGKITIKSGSIIEEVDVKIADTVTKIACDKTIISVAPNEVLPLTITAYLGSAPIVSSPSSFVWRLSSSTIGTVKDGVFTGSSSGGTGDISISFKNCEIVIPIEVGKLPIMISTFENVTIGSNWLKTIENSGNGGKGEVSINTDERYVKFGEKSLRIDYDFRSAIATTSVTAYQSGGYYKLEGYPTQIGMWVYGDMNGANVRIQIRDGNNKVQYISFNPSIVDWEGWQYIEAEIPSGLPTPIQIQYPIRVMSVGGSVKTSGTLYFDNLRAVYGFKNDDVLEPTVKEFTPLNNAVVSNNQEPISITVYDKEDVNKNKTGINKDSIKMWLNDTLITNLVIVDNTDGTIKINYTPSALSLLRPGPQIIKVRVEDNYGNITIKNWQFLLTGEYAGVNGVLPSSDVIFAGDSVEYIINTNSYKNFEKVTGIMNFNNKAVQISNIKLLDDKLALTSKNITEANNSGTWNWTLTGMKDNMMLEGGGLIKITFTPKEGFNSGADTNVNFNDVLVYETGYTNPTKFLLPSYEGKVDYRYRLNYITSTVGNPITFTVCDHELNPIAGVMLDFSLDSIKGYGVTDDKGQVTVDTIKDLTSGTSFTVKAIKGTNYSGNVNVTIRDSLGTSTPNHIVVSPGENTTNSVNITWQTDLNTVDTKVNYRIKGETEWQLASGKSERVYVKNNGVTQEYLAHMILLQGLTANSEYEYNVGDGVTNSENLSFKTTPNLITNIVFLGDPQNTSTAGYSITKNALDAALNTLPSAQMILYAGDIVDDVTIYNQWQAFNSVLSSYNQKYIVSAASGNHDVITGYAKPFVTSLAPQTNGIEVIGANYYYETGNACIAVIDTETVNKFDDEAKWLADVMVSTTKKFKIVLMHRSPYAANYDEPHIRDYWPKVFEEAGIDLVLSGHDHVYSSTTMKNSEKTLVSEGVTYVVGGSCGQKFYSANNLESRYWLDYLYDDDYPIFSTIEIKGSVLTLVSYALEGTQSVEINRIVLTAKENNVGKVEIKENNEYLTLYHDLTLEGKIYDKENNLINDKVVWKLKEENIGLNISSDGVLTLSNDYSGENEVIVIALYKGVSQEIVIKVTLLRPTEVMDELIKEQKAVIDEIFK